MAQPTLCDAHQATGILLTSTLIPPVETMVFCPECLPAHVMMLAEGLGLIEQIKDMVLAEERARVEKETAREEQGLPPAKPRPRARKRVDQAVNVDDVPAGEGA